MIGAFESSMFRMRAFLALHSLVNVRESRCKIAEIDLAKGGRQIDRHGGAGPRSVLRTERHAASGGPDGNFRVALLFRFARVFASQRKAAAAANVEDDLAVFRIGQETYSYFQVPAEAGERASARIAISPASNFCNASCYDPGHKPSLRGVLATKQSIAPLLRLRSQ
jgi:hypothetical protein